MARLTLVVDLPTPPLPLLTITKFLIWGAKFFVPWGLLLFCGEGCLISKLSLVMPLSLSFCVILSRNVLATSAEAEESLIV